VGVAGSARAADSPDTKAIIQKALEAAGGEAKLEKHKAVTMKGKGTVNVMGMAIEFTAEFQQQPPKQSKTVIQGEAGGQKFEFVVVLNGDKGWMKVMGTTVDLEGDRLEEQKNAAYSAWVGRLVPLLREKGFKLSPLGDVTIDKKEAVGVKVSRDGQRDIDLFFDKKTGLLLKSQSRVKDESGQEFNQESFYHDYKDADGIKRPGKVVVKRDGKDYLDMAISDYKPIEKLEDSEFAKP
jgi:hypothetical protein